MDDFTHQTDMFGCSDIGGANYFLGFYITLDRSKKVFEIGQKHYMDKVWAKFEKTDCH